MKKEKWTEDEILSIAFESDKFERKSGELLSDGDFENAIAKQLSAFANSEGGHILLGVKDDGSFDGVSQVYKGQTKTIEWLGQKITDLVVPSLQNFRVHEAERSVNSKIPNDKILIVIDVGRSELAPHQSSRDSHYYHRVDKESKPAPHRYVELLFNREKFPGPRVANAWLQTVINPLIYALKQDKSNLEKEWWGFDMHRQNSLPCVNIILDKFSSGNVEQFFLNYQDLFKVAEEHDDKAQFLIKEVGECHQQISEHFSRHFYPLFTSIEKLQFLKEDSAPNSHKFQNCEARADYIKVLFPSDDPEHNSKLLTQCIINDAVGGDYTYAPLWVVHQSSFQLARNPEYARELSRIRDAALVVLTETKKLLEILEKERIDLCVRNCLPFEEHTSTVLQTAYPPLFQ